ncbi:conserved exported hypothetical protein [Microbacterium sp. C448]|uniref:hypothetical protein n=1 Tax=Microbacterium sp. C448 TaxID=1177594 RepID=UPI0003DE1060|nr:hypothetical protein [Microbacterium sp. C448]CDJ98895.1 conserved exported hypothetical protein [Microbacterium sp. C448]
MSHRARRSPRRQLFIRSARACVALVAGAALILGGGVAASAAAAPVEGTMAAVSSPDTAVADSPSSASIRPSRLDGFDPQTLIDDALFYDGAAMTAAQIQTFLDQRIGQCTNGQCINVLSAGISSRGSIVSARTGNLVCSPFEGGTMRVSEIIYRLQVACGISARVILVTLEKEQSLVSSRAPSDRNLRFAMGANCPDTAPCDPAYAGIGPQIVAGTTQLKTYRAGAFSRQPGVHFIGYHPNAACGGTNLQITNYATAALYNYTPYQPNAAALRAGYGMGDGCSSYGNRNFYNFYTDWFGAATNRNPNGPIGNVESVQAAPGVFRITGWVLDPDTSASIDVHVYVNGVGRAFTANLDRPDVAAAYPGFGSRHGFSVTVPAGSAGVNSLCVYGINVGLGGNSQIGCQTKLAMSGSPVGVLEAAVPVAGGVSVGGWALDPDTSAPIDVHIYVGAAGVALTADLARTDIATAYPGYGSSHGFSRLIQAPAGRQTVCAYGINVAVGVNVELGCVTVDVPAPSDRGLAPIGVLESLTVRDTTVSVIGWAIDPDTAWPIQIRVEGAGRSGLFTADHVRADVGSAYPQYGANHGFSAQLTLPVGTADVCVYAVNTGTGGDTNLGCRSVVAALPDLGRAPIGVIDSIDVRGATATISGWALDLDNVDPVPVHIYVGASGTAHVANRARPDLAAAFPLQGADHGFTEALSLPPGSSSVCVYAINLGRGGNSLLGCQTVTAVDNTRPPIGNFEQAVGVAGGVAVGGWAFDPDSRDPIPVHIYVDGVGAAISADVARPDVAAAYGRTNPLSGFAATIAALPGVHRVCAYAINDGPGVNTLLGCRDVTVP